MINEQNIFRNIFLLFLIGYFQTITRTLQIKIDGLIPKIFQKFWYKCDTLFDQQKAGNKVHKYSICCKQSNKYLQAE